VFVIVKVWMLEQLVQLLAKKELGKAKVRLMVEVEGMVRL